MMKSGTPLKKIIYLTETMREGAQTGGAGEGEGDSLLSRDLPPPNAQSQDFGIMT